MRCRWFANWCGGLPSDIDPKDLAAEPQRHWSLDRIEKEVNFRRKNSHLKANLISEDISNDIRDFYDFDRAPILGAGCSGAVRKCQHKVTGNNYAIKSLTKKNVKADKIIQLRDEIKIMSEIDHPNIIVLQETFENADIIYLVLELCTGGELLTRLNNQPHHHFSEYLTRKYVKTMLECIAYLHAHNIVHRDLKLENFVFENESSSSELKLIDFGLSKHFEETESIHGAVGTPFYVAPEVLSNKYNEKCDIWSIGVMAFMLHGGFPPFNGDTDKDTMELVKTQHVEPMFRHKAFDNVSKDAITFIETCLDRDYERRPAARDLLNHKWFLNDVRPKRLTLTPEMIVSLRSFAQQKTLVKVCLEVIAHTLTNDQLIVLRRQFSEFDIDNQGMLRRVDLEKTLQNYGEFASEDIDTIFKGIDVDHNDKFIRYHEFLAAALSLDDLNEANFKAAFLALAKHEEFISIDNIREILGADLNESELLKLLDEVGLSVNDSLTYEAFKSIIQDNCDNNKI